MLYPILTVVCLLLRGQLSLQRKDTLIETDSNSSSNGINTSISSCSVEELSKLLTNRIAMNKALELATRKQSQTKEEFVNNILKWVHQPTPPNPQSNSQEPISPDNELQKIVDNDDSPPVSHNFHPILMNRFEAEPEMPTPPLPPLGQRRPFKGIHTWPFDSIHAFPLFLPHRNLKPPPGAKIKIEFKDKKREVTINVSPLMTVLEALKQAEIKFRTSFKLSMEDDLISFWSSPSLGCIVVDRVSFVQNDKAMMWRLSIINNIGEVEYEDFCLPANGEVFVKPGSIIQLIYTSVRNVKDIY